MKKNFINDLAKKYAAKMNPNARSRGLALSLATGAVVYGIGMGAMAIQANIKSENTGNDFNSSWKSVRSEYGNNWRNGTIGMMVFAYLFIELAIASSRKDAKRHMEFIAKHYLRDLHIKIISPDNLVYQDIANMILSNMTNDERADLLEHGVSVGKELEKNDVLTLSGDRTPAQSDVIRKKILADSKNMVAKTIDSVIARNPGLEQVIFDILSGKTYYNLRAFNQKQR